VAVVALVILKELSIDAFLMLVLPKKVPAPATSNFVPGSVVPMPTLPPTGFRSRF
jgi:hypothetical protein